MPQDKLPLFPLGVVLFPGAQLPLHIFEERYKEMMADVQESGREFGVVMASEKGLASIGCSAVIERVLKRYPDGRSDILARGKRRFEILFIHQDRSFLEGTVEPLPDDNFDDAPDLVRQRVLSAWTNLMILEHGGVPNDVPDARHPNLSFLLGDAIPDLVLRQKLLSLRGEKQRLEFLLESLPGYVERERMQKEMKRVAPLNGFGKHFYQA
jgi:Lon protease-like protein